MIIPSIDLQNGRAVQLRQGRDLLLEDPRDPVELAREFGRYGPVAVIDLDAALGRGQNESIVRACCRVAECRVGGGLRSEEQVRDRIRWGAKQVIVGTKADEAFLRQFPREWIIAAVDARGSDVVVEGWTSDAGERVLDRASRLESLCSEFLFTQVKVEGMLEGPDLETAAALKERISIPITVAGGIRSAADVRALDQIGCNSQIGRSLYEEKLSLAESWVGVVRFDEKGLVPTVVQDAKSGSILMLAYSNAASLERALKTGRGWYWSRSRSELWEKGATSGNRQRLVSARWDCDRDTVVFRVDQIGPACHLEQPTCFGFLLEDSLDVLESDIATRSDSASGGSYTRKLIDDEQLIASKLKEEIDEVIDATDRDNQVWEYADVFYHLMVHMRSKGIPLSDVRRELRSRRRG